MILLKLENCPKCDILEEKLKELPIVYDSYYGIKDKETLQLIGLERTVFPVLILDDSTELDYYNAVQWIKKAKENLKDGHNTKTL